MAKTNKSDSVVQNFYGDTIARSFLRVNIPRYEAYQMGHAIWKMLAKKKKNPQRVKEFTEAILQEKYPQLIEKYRDWGKITEFHKPLIVLVGGGTGVGTSTIAMRLAWLLDINHILSTDSVREVIRQFVRKEVLPVLHTSSYETGQIIGQIIKSDHDRLIYGFLTQSQEVQNGIKAVIKRAITEKTNVIIEGVHLIPGEMTFLERYRNKADIIEIMLDVNQKAKHRLHLLSRGKQNKNRDQNGYLSHFREIRLIRDYLISQAEKNDVPVIQNYDLRKAEKEILGKIYNHYEHRFK